VAAMVARRSTASLMPTTTMNGRRSMLLILPTAEGVS
jgi:hypothetical protein